MAERLSAPKQASRLRPKRSDIIPKGKDNRAAISKKAEFMIPTNTASAPRDWAYRGTTGSRMCDPKKPPKATPQQIRAFKFPAIPHLEKMLARLPEDTLKIVIIPPFHYFHQAAPGSMEDIKWKEFKRRVIDTVCRHPNTSLFDFMIESPITTRDENFLDKIHYTVPVAQTIARSIALGAFSDSEGPNFNRFCSKLTSAIDGKEDSSVGSNLRQ